MNWRGITLALLPTALLLVALLAMPSATKAQDLTDCFSMRLLDHQEDEEKVLQAYGFTNNCEEWTSVAWFQRSVDDDGVPTLYEYGYLNTQKGETAATTWVSWRKADGPFSIPVIAWCGWREDYGRCSGENDFRDGSRANWRWLPDVDGNREGW